MTPHPSLAIRLGVWLVTLAAGAGMLARPGVARGADPDPRALLRSVEAARNGIKSGKVEMLISYRNNTFAKHPRPPTRLVVAFDEGNRRFDQFTRQVIMNPGIDFDNEKLKALDGDSAKIVEAGLGLFRHAHIRSFWDGGQLVEYTPGSGAYIRDETKGSSYFNFDVRTLGIARHHGITTLVEDAFLERRNRTITLVGRDEVNGHPTWQVQIVDRRPDGISEEHYWIEDVPGFPVWQVEESSFGRKTTVTSEYATPVAARLLPIAVRTVTRDANGAPVAEESITVGRAELNIPVDPAAWSLATMGIPLRQMIIDERIHRGVGYFDGEGLQEDLGDALRIGRAIAGKPSP